MALDRPQIGRSRPLDEPLPGAPLVLLEQNAPRRGQSLGADIVERPEDALAIFDGERDYLFVTAAAFLVPINLFTVLMVARAHQK